MIEKLFKAYDVRATYPDPLNEDAAWKIGYATALFLRDARQKANLSLRQANSVIVGRDMRPHSPSLARSLSEGIRSAGLDVIDIGMIDTSMVYFAINHEECCGGVQTTASHNPVQYNGFKISGFKAKPIGENSGLMEIRKTAAALGSERPAVGGRHVEKDLFPPYREHVRKFLTLRRKLRVAVDASNGMAGKFVPYIFGGMADLELIPINFEITGSFVHDPNPLVEANLKMLQAKMAETRPDLGVCFDGDADRCIFLTEDGKPVGCDLVTAMLARDFLHRPENKGSTILYDLRSSHVVADEVKAAGGVPRRERVGHAFMKKTLAETGGVFGGELSGHFYFRDNFNADSGAIAFARLLSVLSSQEEPFSGLVAPLRRYAQSGEMNFQVEDKDGKIKELAARYKGAQIDYLDGITVDFGDWWFNVRKSNTEPLLRLNMEATSSQLLQAKLSEIKGLLGEPIHGH